MNEPTHISNITSQKWALDQINISHNTVDYKSFGISRAANKDESVRLHFGLKGSYNFYFAQLNTTYKLSGHHNNIMYSKGLDIEVENKTKLIETFGVNFNPKLFIGLAKNGNDTLKRFSEKVFDHKNALISPVWKPNNYKIEAVIQDILNCQFTNELKNLFLFSKSIELLVLQADLYSKQETKQFIKSASDKSKLIEAKEILHKRLDNPPTLTELSKLISLNEFKVKNGFKELFGQTVFGYVHQHRMDLAKNLLLDTARTVKEISYEIGYSSPQHFSKAFKNQFGKTPNSIRNNPDFTLP